MELVELLFKFWYNIFLYSPPMNTGLYIPTAHALHCRGTRDKRIGKNGGEFDPWTGRGPANGTWSLTRLSEVEEES